jgi:tripartite-type tricarboxylate transporter receptor subunit TctC
MRKALVVVALVLACVGAAAQDYPTKPITIVVPFGPGGPTDIIGRILAQKISVLGQQGVVSNVPGAGGSVGAVRVLAAKPDGYTLYMGNMGTHVLAAVTSSKLPYDPIRDFAPVSLGANAHSLLVARNGLPRDVKDLIEQLKKMHGKATYSSSGVGSVTHVICGVFALQSGIPVVHVPYKSGAATLQDVVRGEIDFACATPGTSKALVDSGRLQAIVMGGNRRSPILPNVPTAKEAGIPDFGINAWQALFAPRGTPSDVVGRLGSAVAAGFDDADVQKQYATLGLEVPQPAERGPEALARLIAHDAEHWLPIIRKLDLPRD